MVHGPHLPLEQRDPVSGKWLLYRSQEEHSSDCEMYPYDAVPSGIFLDTSVINLLVKFSGSIFELEPLPSDLPQQRTHDIEALMHLMQAGERANWLVTTSPRAIEELALTPDTAERTSLVDYGRGYSLIHTILATTTLKASDAGRSMLLF